MSKFLKSLILIVIFLIGAALIVLPFLYDLFNKANSIDDMMKAPWLMVGLGAAIVVLLLLRLALWKPAKKEKEPEPAKPAPPTV